MEEGASLTENAVSNESCQVPTLPIHAPKPLCTFEWQPLDSLTTDENLLDLAVVIARNSKRNGGHMGCVLVGPCVPLFHSSCSVLLHV